MFGYGSRKSIIQMQVREEMLNGFGLIHGGIAFSLADSALAFASNAYGRLSVALECSISYPAPVNNGDTLTATAEELSLTNRIGVYQITISNQQGVKVAFSKALFIVPAKNILNKNETSLYS